MAKSLPRDFIFTSESVSEGHPDKICDQISDAILDAILAKDKNARVACEALIKDEVVVLAGEITSNAQVNYENIVRDTLRGIGYTDTDIGCCADTCKVEKLLGNQSPDIAQGVDENDCKQQGAGDQGLMFGYATNETDRLMPAPIDYAHRLVKRQAEVRKSGEITWLRPDAKSQISLRYENQRPVCVDTIVFSTQHDAGVSLNEIKSAVKETIIKPVLPAEWLTQETKFLINPTGVFEIGGPAGDCGLTGRKIIVDTYGGMARHGGGAFSGKDPSKVDRSAAYAARYIAKNIVAAGLSSKCEIQLSYAIGVAEPISINVETFGTNCDRVSDEQIKECILRYFDLTPQGIIQMLDLLQPIYFDTAAYGHFGRDGFSWERCDKAEFLKEEFK